MPLDADNPSISVVIPTWNRSLFIERAINSVLSQTLPPLEILVCDDGSTDATEEIVAALSLIDSRVRWVPGTRGGLPAIPRNRGIRVAQGEWIAFLDSDDVWLEDKLHEQVKSLLCSKPRILASCSNAYRVAKNLEGCQLLLPQHTSSKQITFFSLIADNSIITSSALIHSSLLRHTGGFPEDKNLRAIEDYALWLRVATISNIQYISQPLLRYTDDPLASVRKEGRGEWANFGYVIANYLCWLIKFNRLKFILITIEILFYSIKKYLRKLFFDLLGIAGICRRSISSFFTGK